MKIFNWIQLHKYPIMVTAFFIALGMCLYFFFQGMKKDYTLELTIQKLDYQEQARQAVIKERMAWEQLMLEQTKTIIGLRLKDSLVNSMAGQNAIKIQQISNPQYAKEKTLAVDNFSDADLQHYFDSLREPNDYEGGDLGR